MERTVYGTYRVPADALDMVKLKIAIGHGQLGVTSVHLDGKVLVKDKEGLIQQDIGPCKELVGKELRCSTLVQDVRSETNKTSVRYDLSGGPKKHEENLEHLVQSDGEVVWYTATYFLY